MYLSITYFRVKSLIHYPAFMKHVSRINTQVHKAEGVLEVKQRIEPLFHAYTMTLWESREYMLQFMHSGAHKAAMPDTRKLATRFTGFGFDTQHIIDWKEAKRLVKERLSAKKTAA